MTQPNEGIMKYAAGVKLSAAMNKAAIVLLEAGGGNVKVIAAETLTCSSNLRDVFQWIDKHTAGAGVQIVAGVDSSAIRFLDIRIPAVDQSQQHRLLQTQAEAVLPLKANEIALAWQAEQDPQGLLCKTAVIRRQLLQPILDRTDRIATVCPEAVSLATVWKHHGGARQQSSILLYRRDHDILAALLKNGRLLRSAVIDADSVDLQNNSPTGLLLQDIQAEFETMQAECREKPSVYILSEKPTDAFLDALCNQIQRIGFDSEVVFLEDIPKKNGLVHSLEAFGLALTAASGGQIDYDFRLAETINRPEQAQTKIGIQLRNAIAITIALLVLALGTSYWKAKKDVKLLRDVMSTGYEDLTVQQALKELSYRESIAKGRPDMVDLFERIQKCTNGILLDTFEFEKGKPVKITATARSYDAIYQFQEDLESQNKNIIKATRLMDPRMETKGNKIRFTITFHYRNFSQ